MFHEYTAGHWASHRQTQDSTPAGTTLHHGASTARARCAGPFRHFALQALQTRFINLQHHEFPLELENVVLGINELGLQRLNPVLDRNDVCVVGRLVDGPVPSLDRVPAKEVDACLLYTSPSPRDGLLSRMPSSA